MKEKKEELWQLMLDMTFDDKATYEKVMGAVNEATGEHGFVSSIGHGKVKGLHIEDKKEPEVFQPKAWDICTCVIEGNVDAIFCYDGRIRTDKDGAVWLHGDPSLTWSGDLFKPYMIIHGDGVEFLQDNCRPATEEEIALFRGKLMDNERTKAKEEKKWKVGDWVFIVGSDSGGCKAFFPVYATYAETKVMENIVRRGWVFDKKEDCEAVCDKLNEAIKNVK